MRIKIIIFTIALIYCSYSCFALGDTEFPKIEKKRPAHRYNRGELKEIPGYDPANLRNQWQVDLRHYDLSKLDLREHFQSLIHASFDNKTIWPPAKNMPDSFQPAKVLEQGKDPGLDVRKLHARGITGRGIGIAIIDQPTLVEHSEYKDRLSLYTEINIEPSAVAQMHGPALCSILAGKSIGTAPGVDLYFLAAWPGTWTWKDGKKGFDFDLTFFADALKKVIEINRRLPSGKKIRAAVIALGFSKKRKGYTAMIEAVNMAKKEGIFVISCSLDSTYRFKFHGLGRDPMADPNRVNSYSPAVWWQEAFFQGKTGTDRLLFPMDSRTLAAATGAGDYAFYRFGGWSWVVPYIAGLYALSCQVKTDITPDEFWKKALSTGSFKEIKKGDNNFKLGPIVNPAAVIDSIVKK